MSWTITHTPPPRLTRRSRASWNAQDSPSRQLLTDLENELDRLRNHVADVHKLHLLERVTQRNGFDEHDAKTAKEQLAGLDKVLLRQEAIRKDAEAELDAWRQKVADEEARRRREEEERLRREEEARKEAEREKRERQEAERRAAEERARAEVAKLEAEKKAKEEADRRAKAEAEEKSRKDREAAAQREEAARAKAEQEQQRAAKQKAEAVQIAQQNLDPSDSQKDTVHERYLQIHRNLKKFRKPFWEQCRKDPNLKTQVGDIRRLIRKAVAQLVDLKGNTKALPIETTENLTAAEIRARQVPPSNTEATRDVKKALSLSVKIQTTNVDVRDYVAFPPPSIANDPSPTVPALLIYALNIFSKSLISQLATEAGVVTARAEPTGVLAAQIFPIPDYTFKGYPLIDILLAKFHLVCPPLFGINGLESSLAGRTRLGWWKEPGSDTFISSARHHERMTGFAAGYAALSLRNFSKSRLPNPYPPHHFWETLASILNLPPNAVQATHLTILKGLIVQSVERFLLFYEETAVALLRRTVTTFPDSLPEATKKLPQCGALRTVGESLAKDARLTIV